MIDPFGLDSDSDVVKAPGFGESLIPVWGSGRQSIHDFQCGHYVWGTVNAALAISDVFLVKSLFTAAGKVGVKGLAKLAGNNTWGATSIGSLTTEGEILLGSTFTTGLFRRAVGAKSFQMPSRINRGIL